jgi:hypothetical protein
MKTKSNFEIEQNCTKSHGARKKDPFKWTPILFPFSIPRVVKNIMKNGFLPF